MEYRCKTTQSSYFEEILGKWHKIPPELGDHPKLWERLPIVIGICVKSRNFSKIGSLGTDIKINSDSPFPYCQVRYIRPFNQIRLICAIRIGTDYCVGKYIDKQVARYFVVDSCKLFSYDGGTAQ